MNIRITLMVAILTMTACQTQKPKQPLPIEGIVDTLEQGRDNAEKAAANPTPPPSVLASLMPPMQIQLGIEEEDNDRFDVNVINTPAREFFMSLVDGTKYNMVVHPGVDGDLSLALKNVTIPEVMQTLRDVYGYEYQRTRSGFNVMPVRMQSRIYQVNYLNVKRSGNSEMRISSGGMTETTESTDSTSSSSSESLAASKVVTESESDFWGDLQSILESLVNIDEGRSVVISPHSGLIVVKAMPSELRDVENYLRLTQATLQRQVILEAKIIEVELNDGFQSGINWGKMMSLGGNSSITLGQTGGGSTLSSATGVSGISGNAGNVNPAGFTSVDALATSAFGGVFTAAIRTGNFAAFIELLESQGQAQVLSSPRVSTVNNQKAVIKVGQDEYYVTDVSTTVTTGTTTTSTPDITLTPFFSGIALDVTPQIDEQGGVTLHIHPTVSTVEDQSKSFTVDDKTQTLPLALSKVRESDSIIYAQSGQIVVIGGLMQETASEATAAPPVLGDLPFIGAAFRHTKQVSKKTELVVLLKPVVINGTGNWGKDLGSVNRRINKLTRGFHVGGKPDVFGTEGEVYR